MRLPGELRNRIYGLSMVSDVVLDPVWGCVYDLSGGRGSDNEYFLKEPTEYPRYRSQLYQKQYGFEPNAMAAARMANMSQVCKAWREESLKYYYGSNIFKFPMGKHIHERKGRTDVRSTAERIFYTRWLFKFPKEAFSVLRLVLQGYRPCPHPLNEMSDQRQSLGRGKRRFKEGTCMIFLDFQQKRVFPVQGVSKRDRVDLWHCQICWMRFTSAVQNVNDAEEVTEAFESFQTNQDAKTAITIIDTLRSNIEV